MNAENTYSSSLNGGHCLSTVALRQYVDGTLPKSHIHKVEKHLLDCDFCTHVLEDMDVTEEGRTVMESISQNVNRRILEMVGEAPKPGIWVGSRKYFFIGGGALILLTGILLYPFRNHKETSSSIPVIPTPASTQTIPAATETKKPAEDEFEIKQKDPAPVSEKTETVSVPGKVHEEEAPPAVPVVAEPAPNPAPAAVKKEDPKPEVVTENINYADLQIVSVKVLQLMSKTSGSSRKESRNGQIAKARDVNAAYFLPEDMPNYPGGNEAMEEYLTTHFKNPVKDKRILTGKAVGIMFTVSSKGRISDVEITKSLAPELDVELIRLISTMPSWNPAKHKGDITCVLAVTVK
ncbi:MAG: energy transducer TonB [Bacteroidia bacterium]